MDHFIAMMDMNSCDFTKEEIDMAIKKGFKPISLGNNRLRTETAGITALSIMKFC